MLELAFICRPQAGRSASTVTRNLAANPSQNQHNQSKLQSIYIQTAAAMTGLTAWQERPACASHNIWMLTLPDIIWHDFHQHPSELEEMRSLIDTGIRLCRASCRTAFTTDQMMDLIRILTILKVPVRTVASLQRATARHQRPGHGRFAPHSERRIQLIRDNLGLTLVCLDISARAQ